MNMHIIKYNDDKGGRVNGLHIFACAHGLLDEMEVTTHHIWRRWSTNMEEVVHTGCRVKVPMQGHHGHPKGLSKILRIMTWAVPWYNLGQTKNQRLCSYEARCTKADRCKQYKLILQRAGQNAMGEPRASSDEHKRKRESRGTIPGTTHNNMLKIF